MVSVQNESIGIDIHFPWGCRGHGRYDGLGSLYVVFAVSFTFSILKGTCEVHARARGAETWWKSFTTGKSAEHLGGVPHDTYGMTSLSVRQYVVGIYKQLGLQEKNITKVQTGGPGMCYLIQTFRIHSDYCVVVQQTAILAQVSCHWPTKLFVLSNNFRRRDSS